MKEWTRLKSTPLYQESEPAEMPAEPETAAASSTNACYGYEHAAEYPDQHVRFLFFDLLKRMATARRRRNGTTL